MKTELCSTLGPAIRRFVILKRSLGLNYFEQANILLSLDRFLTKNGFGDLTAEAFLGWCKSFSKLSGSTRRLWMRTVRDLCLYRRRTERDCFVPDDSTFPGRHQSIRPYIFSVSEIQRLLKQCRHLKRHPYSPVRPELLRLAIVLLFTTGLRHGELLRLTIQDYNPSEGTLFIRDSKFHKSRLLPLRKDVVREIDCYLNTHRRRHLSLSPKAPLVWTWRKGKRPCSHQTIWRNVRLLLKMAKVHKPDGRLPRVHDFRHSFAVNALLRWYRSGADVQSKLPFLSAYMGHVNIASTYYYLHFVEPLASLASARFASHYGALVRLPAKPKGGSK
jgi:integrase/recombinase XerD